MADQEKPGEGFDIPRVKQQHASRWIFLSIGIFIAGILLLAIVFISYRLLTATPPVASPSPLPPVVFVTPNPTATPEFSPLPPVGGVSDASDSDQDGLTSAEEKHYGTDTAKADSDGDGFPDPDERKFGTDPLDPDTDGDGYSDGAEITAGYNPLITSPNDKL